MERGQNRGRGRSRARGDSRGGSPARGGSPIPRGGSPTGGPRGGGPGHRGGQGAPPGGRGGRGGFRGGAPAPPGELIFNPGTPLTHDARLSKTNLDTLVASFKRAPSSAEMPLRPDWGTKGKAITLRANFFAVKLPKNIVIYEYEIKYTESSPRGRVKKEIPGNVRGQILSLLEQAEDFGPYLGHIAHDRRTRLVSSRPLPDGLAFDILYIEEEETAPRAGASTYHVTFELKNELNSNELTQAMEGNLQYRHTTLDNTGPGETLSLISALNLVLQQHAARTGVRFGKNRYFFASGNSDVPLSLGLFARRGFFLSVRPTFKQLMVNVNVCMTAFYEPGNLAEAMLVFQRESRGGMPNSFVQRLQVVTRHLGYRRKHTLLRIARNTARQEKMYYDEEKKQISIEEFFKKKYNISLRHAHDLPLVDATPPSSRNRTYLPAELCEIPPNQPFKGLLEPDATAAMIKVAARPPQVNAQAIVNQGFPSLGLQANAVQGPVSGFGLEVSNDMAVIPARVLDSPAVAYKTGRTNVRDASWNIVNVKFQSGGDMRKWAVLHVTEGRRDEFQGLQDPNLRNFLQTFQKKCADSGMTVPNGPPSILATPRLPRYDRQADPYRIQALDLIRTTLQQGINPRDKPAFILVLLSGVDDHIYPGIKSICDVELGLHTVTMLLTKARNDSGNKQDQYFSNVALKVNIKLGGHNHALDQQSMTWLRQKKTMMIGMDVTHPSPKSRKGTPSVVAVVASIDDHFVQYPASLAIQRNANINREAEEMVQDLSLMLLERLQLYQKRNGNQLPQRIIVFRDGVSEGQFPLVLRHELPQYFATFKKFQGGNYKPTLSIIVCGKRHHAKNYATGQDHVMKNGNTPPGTVVDQGITDVFNHDFYLQAHHGLQGSVKSTHYTVVYDENKMSADTVQELTNRNSYLYARATKAVSLIPPAYYADLACERARLYLNRSLNLADSDAQSTVGSAKGGGKKRTKEDEQAEREQVFQEAVQAWGDGLNPALRESMFYI